MSGSLFQQALNLDFNVDSALILEARRLLRLASLTSIIAAPKLKRGPANELVLEWSSLRIELFPPYFAVDLGDRRRVHPITDEDAFANAVRDYAKLSPENP